MKLYLLLCAKSSDVVAVYTDKKKALEAGKGTLGNAPECTVQEYDTKTMTGKDVTLDHWQQES